LPLIVGGSDGFKYVVKLRGSGDGVLANVVEWLGVKLGLLMQIPILQPELLMIDASFVEETKDQDPEIVELLERSVGINFATRYLEDVTLLNERNSFSIDKALKSNIFLYDLFLLNIDRSPKNTNMILNGNELWCLDYSSSITMMSVVAGKNYRQEEIFLKEIKRHPFYNNEIIADDFIVRLKAIGDKAICDLVEELPEEWMQQLNVGKETRETRKTISDRLIDKKNETESLKKRLEILKALKIETEEERKLRVLKNKKAFEEKLGRI